MDDPGVVTVMTSRVTAVDALLVLMVVIWGVNYSVIKLAFAEIPPQPFNALRMSLASVVFLAAIRLARRRARVAGAQLSPALYTPHELTARDRLDLVWLGLIGHFGYQFCFASGVAADQRLERRAHHRRDAGRDCRHLGRARTRAHRPPALDRRRHLHRRHLFRRRPRRVVRRRDVRRRPAHDRVGRLLGRVHARRQPADRAPLAALRHRDDDGDWRRCRTCCSRSRSSCGCGGPTSPVEPGWRSCCRRCSR